MKTREIIEILEKWEKEGIDRVCILKKDDDLSLLIEEITGYALDIDNSSILLLPQYM